MRHEHEDDLVQWPGKYWLSTPEIMEIETTLVKYADFIAPKIQDCWFEAKKNGPQLEGPYDAESETVWNVYDLEKMLGVIKKETTKKRK